MFVTARWKKRLRVLHPMHMGVRGSIPHPWHHERNGALNELELLGERATELEDDQREMYREFGTLLDHMVSISKELVSVLQRHDWPEEEVRKLREWHNAREMQRRQP